MLRLLRLWRGRFWRWQIIAGDLIAICTGRFVRRWVLKKTLKRTGKHLRRFTG